MNNNSKISQEKINKIDDFSNGEWICFLLATNKKCVGIIVEMLIPSKSDDNMFDAFKIVNYIDEDGMSGSIKVSDIKKTQRVIGVDINSFFEKKFTLKIEGIAMKNNSRKIARDFMKQSNLKKFGKINKN